MLTRRGVSTLTTSAALLVGGTLLAAPEFVVTGLLLLFVLLAAVVSVWMPNHRAANLVRTVEPRHPHAGTAITATLTAEPKTSRVFVTERLPAGNSITAGLSRSTSGGPQTLSYVTTPLPRGVTTLGPATATRTDFLRLARRQYRSCAPSAIVVWPAVVAVEPETMEQLCHTTASGRSNRARMLDPRRHGASFEGDLRAYVPGDEPKRVHWPSSAKAGQLIVRTDALPEPADHRSITADLSVSAHTHESFELALSTMASITLAMHTGSLSSAFETTLKIGVLRDGDTTMFRTPRDLLDHLAAATFGAASATASNAHTSGAGRTSSARPSLSAALVASANSLHQMKQRTKRGGFFIVGPQTTVSSLPPNAVVLRCADAERISPSDTTVEVQHLRMLPTSLKSLAGRRIQTGAST